MTLISVVLVEEAVDLLREARMVAAVRARYDREIEDALAVDLNKITLAALCESIYSGVERALLVVAKEVDGEPIPKTDSWHRDLIERMRNPFGSRGAVLSAETAALMDDLRGFRHKVRSHYGSALSAHRVRELSFQAEALAKAAAAELEVLALSLED